MINYKQSNLYVSVAFKYASISPKIVALFTKKRYFLRAKLVVLGYSQKNVATANTSLNLLKINFQNVLTLIATVNTLIKGI